MQQVGWFDYSRINILAAAGETIYFYFLFIQHQRTIGYVLGKVNKLLCKPRETFSGVCVFWIAMLKNIISRWRFVNIFVSQFLWFRNRWSHFTKFHVNVNHPLLATVCIILCSYRYDIISQFCVTLETTKTLIINKLIIANSLIFNVKSNNHRVDLSKKKNWIVSFCKESRTMHDVR
jgi:hypothetical protein